MAAWISRICGWRCTLWRLAAQRLGYRRYGAQGGDWGSVISRELGLTVPGQVADVYLNMFITRMPDDPGELTEEETRRRQVLREFRTSGSGYSAIQSTRPQTLAYGLTDSPAGQLAWITEKFGEWTDGGLPDEAVDQLGSRRSPQTDSIVVFDLSRPGVDGRLERDIMRMPGQAFPRGCPGP